VYDVEIFKPKYIFLRNILRIFGAVTRIVQQPKKQSNKRTSGQ